MAGPITVAADVVSTAQGLQVVLDSTLYRFPPTSPRGIRQQVLVALALYFDTAETLEVVDVAKGKRRGHYVATCRVVLTE